MGKRIALRISSDVPAKWEDKVDLALLTRIAEVTLRAEGIAGAVEVGLTFVDDDEIRELNATYRGVDSATDVLSFPLQGEGDGFVNPPDGVLRLGDIVISLPRATEQAAEYGHPLARELGYLFVHGLLHLLGYDHEQEEERTVMRTKEEAALAACGLTR